MIDRWRQLSARAQRGWIAGAIAVAVFFVVGGLNSIGGRPGGPSLSSYATADQGLAALDELLDANGYDTAPVRVTLDEAKLDPAATLIALGQSFSSADREALRAFAERGGRVVTGGPEAGPFLEDFDADLRWRGDGRARLRPVPSDQVAGLASVQADGLGRWETSIGAPLFEGEGRSAGFVLGVGRGSVVALADPSPLTNGRLDEADNAGFALVVVGPTPRPVAFAENGHGYGLDTGFGALPARWKAALGFAAIAALVGALAAGKRFGPIDPEPETPAPERTVYVDAIASTLARTRDLDAAAAPLRARGQSLVLRRAARGPTTAGDLVDAARLAGLTAEDVRALTEPISTDADLVALGRTVSRIEEH